jgi:hypothetical protein
VWFKPGIEAVIRRDRAQLGDDNVYMPDHAYFGVNSDWAAFVVDPANWLGCGCTVALHTAWVEEAKTNKLDVCTPFAWSASDKMLAWQLLPASIQRACLNFKDADVNHSWFNTAWRSAEPLKHWGIRLLESEKKVGSCANSHVVHGVIPLSWHISILAF